MLRRMAIVVAAMTMLLMVGQTSVASAADRSGASASSPNCPLCVAGAFTAIRVVKAAKAVRQAAKARKVLVAARAAAAAARAQRKFDAVVRRTTREARRIGNRGASYARKKWPGFKRETQGCLYAATTLSTYKYLKDGFLDYGEYYEWYTDMPPGVFTTDPWPPNIVEFPIYVGQDAVLNDPDEFAVACGIGVVLKSKSVGKFPPPA